MPSSVSLSKTTPNNHKTESFGSPFFFAFTYLLGRAIINKDIMPPKKSKKLDALKQIHAKVDSPKPTMLDQVWGFNEISRYGTVDEVEYQAKLKDMTRADLENHARSVGCLVLESSERLREALLKQFRGYVLSLRKPDSNTTRPGKISPEVKRVLDEGR